jgi:tetratricopeptide (TPR) repeat protein
VRELLELTTVAGGPVVQEVAAAAANIDFGEFGKRVAELRAQNLVRTNGARRTDHLEPYHDRVREAVLQHLDSRTRKRWHQRLALALEAAPRADPEALSVHWRGAGDPERAAHYAALAAAAAAQALAFDRSARLYRTAIELRPVEGAALQAQLGHVLAAAGRGGEAALAFLEAAKGANHNEAIELQRHAAAHLLFSGHVDEGIKALGRVLEAVQLTLPPDTRSAMRSLVWRRARVRLGGLGFSPRDASQVKPAELVRIDTCWSVGIGLGLVDNVRGFDYLALHLSLALKAGEPVRIARGLCTELVYAQSLGDTARAAKVQARLDALLKTIDQPLAHALREMAVGIGAYLDGRFRQSLGHLAEADGVLRERCTGVAWELNTTEIVSLWSLFWTGSLKQLMDRAPSAMRAARERGDLFAKTNLRTAMHIVTLLRDDPESARLESLQAMERWSQAGFHTQHYYDLLAQVQCSLYAGDIERALLTLENRWTALEASGQLRVQLVRSQMYDLRARVLLASAALNPPERPQLLAEVESIAKRLRRERRTWVIGMAALLEGAAAAMRGDSARAAELLEVAAGTLDRADMRLHAALARRERGRLIGGDEGRTLLSEAHSWLVDHRVKSPARLGAMLAPGFPDW